MRITDQSTLLHHLSRGAAFTLKEGNLHTLSGTAQKWENVLNLFRSRQNLAQREVATLTAMADMLRPQSASGPENLSAGRRPSSAPGALAARLLHRLAERLEHSGTERSARALTPKATLWEARTNFTQALLTEALGRLNPPVPQRAAPPDTESLYDVPRQRPVSPDGGGLYDVLPRPRAYSQPMPTPVQEAPLYDAPRARSASAPSLPPPLPSPRKAFGAAELGILHSALSSALCAPTVMGTASLAEMRHMVESAVAQALHDTPPSSLRHLRAGFVLDASAMAVQQATLAQDLHTAVNDAVAHAFLFSNNDICLSTQTTFPTERPTVNGVGAPVGEESPAEVNAAYARMLDQFCGSPTEKRTLSYLMGPDVRPSLDRMLADAHSRDASLPLSRIDRPLPESTCALRRGENGDALLDVIVPLTSSGPVLRLDLHDGRNLEVRVREDMPLARLRYTIVVPHDTQTDGESLYEDMSAYEDMSVEEHVYESLDALRQDGTISPGVGGVSLRLTDMRLEVDGQPAFIVGESSRTPAP